MTDTKETLSAQEKYRLRFVRDLQDEVSRLEERLEEMRLQTISSPKMDGMPHGSSTGSEAMVSALIQMQSQEERVKRAKKRLKRAQSAARKAVEQMPAGMRLFFEAYYIDAEKIGTACSIARISESTAYRYMRIAGEKT